MTSEHDWGRGQLLKEVAPTSSSSSSHNPPEDAESTSSWTETNEQGWNLEENIDKEPDGVMSENLWGKEEPANTWTSSQHDWGEGHTLVDASFKSGSSSLNASQSFRSASSCNPQSKYNESMETVSECDTRQRTKEENENVKTTEDRLIYLDDRGTLLYHRDEIPETVQDQLADDYFEVTLDDVKLMLQDRQRQRQELEDIPLKTQALREAESLTRLNKYPKSVLRVQFPDGFVLQCSFKAIDAVSKVEALVRSYLEDESLDFALYIAPPKRVLHAEERLFEIPLVPTAVLHFTCEVPREHYLKQAVLKNVSSLAAANRSATAVRAENRSSASSSSENNVNVAQIEARTTGNLATPSSRPVTRSTGAIPKWFQAGMKK